MEDKKLSLKKNMTWTLSGSIIYALTQWLILVVIAKVGTAEMVGQYVLGLAIAAPIIMFSDLKLRVALITDASSSLQFNDYLGTRLVTIFFAFITMVLAVILFGYNLETSTIIILIGLAKISESVSDIYHGQLQKNERMDFIAISEILKGIFTIFSFSSLLYITRDLVIATIGQVLVWVLLLIFYDCMITRKYTSIRPRFHFKTIKGLIMLTLSLGVMSLFNSINTNIPNYLVEHYLGKENLGYFAAIAYILFAGNRLVDAIRQPAITRLAMYYESRDLLAHRKLLINLLLIGFLIGIFGLFIAYVFGEYILSIIYTPDYAEYSSLFVIIMAAGIFSYPAKFLDAALNSTRSFRIQPYLALVWIIWSLIGGVLLIPIYGLLGAAYVLLIVSFIKFVSITIAVIRVMMHQGMFFMKFNSKRLTGRREEPL